MNDLSGLFWFAWCAALALVSAACVAWAYQHGDPWWWLAACAVANGAMAVCVWKGWL